MVHVMGIPVMALITLLVFFGVGLVIFTVVMRVGIRMLQWVGHLFWSRPLELGRPTQVCPHPGCDRTNAPQARFCGRCGRALRVQIDRYG